jgi:hypothetical protein
LILVVSDLRVQWGISNVCGKKEERKNLITKGNITGIESKDRL